MFVGIDVRNFIILDIFTGIKIRRFVIWPSPAEPIYVLPLQTV